MPQMQINKQNDGDMRCFKSLQNTFKNI